MRGPKPTHPVNLTAEEVKSFQQLIRAQSTPQAVAVRARIILRAYDHPEQNNQQIAQAVGTTIAPCVNGADAGWRPERSPTRRAVGRQGVFPPQVRAQAVPGAALALESLRMSSTRGPRPEPAAHLGQYRKLLAQSQEFGHGIA